MDPYIGEIRLFAGSFAPEGWLSCEGQTLQITQYASLFSILRTIYGGNGTTTFNLPDLRTRIPLGQGQGASPINRPIGECGGENSAALSLKQMPPHTHVPSGTSDAADSSDPTLGLWAKSIGHALYHKELSSPVPMSGTALAAFGSGNPHGNRQPFLAVNFIIAYVGVYPSKPQ